MEAKVSTDGRMISHAQNREDVLLARVFRDVASGFYVDVGASDPDCCSVTRHFYERGWRGINIEPGRVFEKLAAARPRDVNLNVAASDSAGRMTFYEYPPGPLSLLSSLHPEVEGDEPELANREVREVAVRPLRDIFQECAPETIDFMSVDVERHERQVLLGNDWDRYRPRVVLVEATQPRKSTPCYGSWEGILLVAGYEFVHFDGLNRYYLRHEDGWLKERFATPVNVFDDYKLCEVVQLQERVDRLASEAADRDRLIASLRHQLDLVSQHAAHVEAHRAAIEAHAEHVERHARHVEEHARATEEYGRHAEHHARHFEQQLRHFEHHAKHYEQRSHEVEVQLARSHEDHCATREKLEEALRTIAEQSRALEEAAARLAAAQTEATGRLAEARSEAADRLAAAQSEAAEQLAAAHERLAAAHAKAEALARRVESYELLGPRSLELMRRWARFREEHPRVAGLLSRLGK
jgi:FkbM family methyltransferase